MSLPEADIHFYAGPHNRPEIGIVGSQHTFIEGLKAFRNQWITLDGGQSWSVIQLPDGNPPDAVAAISGPEIGLIGIRTYAGRQYVYHSQSPGSTWDLLADISDAAPYDYAGSTVIENLAGEILVVVLFKHPFQTATSLILKTIDLSGSVSTIDFEAFTTNVATTSNQSANELRLFPNPTSNSLFVSGLSSNERHTVSVLDVLGRSVYTQNDKNSTSRLELNLPRLENGIYFLKSCSVSGSCQISSFVYQK